MAAFTCNTFSLPRHRSPSPIQPAAAAPSLRCHHHLLTPFLQKLNTCKPNHSLHFTPLQGPSSGNNNNDNNNNNRGGGGGGGRGDGWNDNFFNFNQYPFVLLHLYLKFEKQYDPLFAAVQDHIYLFLISGSASISYFILSSSEAQAKSIKDEGTVCEIRGGKKIELVPDYTKDEFIVPRTIWFWNWGSKGEKSNFTSFEDVWMKCRELVLGLILPEGFPESVTGDYLEYSLRRGVQGIASQISGVLATQSLLYAVGLGKRAIPTAAAVNWVLKDGIGYLSKILLSKYGRHFDVHPKGWRLFADLLENAAYGMEILTPAFPHLFVPIGAVAGAGRSAAAVIHVTSRFPIWQPPGVVSMLREISEEEFEEYAEKAKTLPESTSNGDKLILYGLYKQATVGNVNTSRPCIFNMRDRAKWDAWKAVEGKSQEEAMGDYITKVRQLKEATA